MCFAFKDRTRVQEDSRASASLNGEGLVHHCVSWLETGVHVHVSLFNYRRINAPTVWAS